MSPPHPPCAFLLSFNRPDFLGQTLESLRRQTVGGWPIFLFQDGPRQGCEAVDEPEIRKCETLFRECFPGGTVIRHQRNLGIGLNMLAAQEHAFRTLGCEVAYFFEDDMVLHELYFEQLVALEKVLRPHRMQVPYFAAYGTIHSVPLPASVRITGDLRFMEHFWGYGLFREPWEEEQDLLRPYFDHLRTVEYTRRDTLLVRSIFRNIGWTHQATSQDGARTVGLCCLGRCAVTTRQPLARYIGNSGTHWSERDFQAWGFSDITPSPAAEAVSPGLPRTVLQDLGQRFREWVAEMETLPLTALRRALQRVDSTTPLPPPPHLEYEVADLQRRIRSYEESTSWRLTKPLRLAGDWIGSWRGKAPCPPPPSDPGIAFSRTRHDLCPLPAGRPPPRPPRIERMTSQAAPLRVSVVIDSHNTSAFIGEAIASVLAQTRPADQIIVSDTSTDASPGIIRDWAARNPRVQPRFTRNRGSLATILAGLEIADGDIVVLLDGDDRFQPDHLEAMERRWLEFPQADLIYCRHKIFGDPELGRIFKLRHLHESSPWHGVIDLGQPYDWGRSTALSWCLPDYHIGGLTSCLSLRRSHFEDLPLPRMIEESGSLLPQNADFIILLASALFGGRKVYVPEQTVEWRLHGASITATTAHGNKESHYRQSLGCSAARGWLMSQPALGPHLRRMLDREMQAVPKLAPGHRDLYLRASQEGRDLSAELRSQIATAVRRVAAIEASTSWRLTAPLRWGVDALRSSGLHPSLRFWTPLRHEKGTVAVDVTNIWHADTGTGIQRVVREVASVLPRLGEPGQIVLVEWSSGVPLDVTDAILSGNSASPPGRPITGMEMIIMLDSSYSLALRLRRQLEDARSKGIKIVSVCHDIFPVTHPDLFERPLAETFRLWLQAASAYSDAFVCNSQHTATEFRGYLKKRRRGANQPLVTAWPLGSNFSTPGPSVPASETDGPPPEDFLLMVGTVEPRKNHAFVLDVLEELWKSGRLERPLVVVGRPGWKCRETVVRLHALEAKGLVFWHGGGLPDWQLRQLYRSASAVIQASLDEGFGLPVAEAALFAKPVVLSDIPVFREIVVADGYFFTQGDREAFTSALFRALDSGAPPTKTVAVSWEESAALFWRECSRLLTPAV